MAFRQRNALRAGVSTQRLRRTSGQSLVETMIALMIIMMIVLGLIHLSMLAATRHVSNYAAFSAARAAMYDGFSGAQGAASDITGVLPKGTRFLGAMPGLGTMRFEVNSPFAYPLFSNFSFGGVMVAARAPTYKQPFINESGDNASPF